MVPFALEKHKTYDGEVEIKFLILSEHCRIGVYRCSRPACEEIHFVVDSCRFAAPAPGVVRSVVPLNAEEATEVITELMRLLPQKEAH